MTGNVRVGNTDANIGFDMEIRVGNTASNVCWQHCCERLFYG